MPPKKVVVKPIPPLPKVLNRVQFKVNSTDFEPNAFPQLDSAALPRQVRLLTAKSRPKPTDTEGGTYHFLSVKGCC